MTQDNYRTFNHKIIDSEVKVYFDNASPKQQGILLALRALIVNANLDISESLKWRLPFYAPVCYLSANKNEVTIGFLLGSVLFDPAKKLQGQGKNIRHLHFHNQDEIDADLISAFLQESKQLHEAIQKQKQLAKPSDSDHLIKKECC